MAIPTVKEIQYQFYRHWLTRYELLAPNIYLDFWSEMDLLGVRKSGYVDEIEIKVSASDFKADFKKTINIFEDERRYRYKEIPKHEALPSGLVKCNYFSFLLPEEIADKCEIPDYAGLFVIRNNYVREVKRAPLLHKTKISPREKYNIGRKMAYRFWKREEDDWRKELEEIRRQKCTDNIGTVQQQGMVP